MRAPTIHINGDRKEVLLEDAVRAHGLVEDAILALRDCAPHGRNYYPQGAGAFEEAAAAHGAMWRKLCEVRDELQALAQEIMK